MTMMSRTATTRHGDVALELCEAAALARHAEALLAELSATLGAFAAPHDATRRMSAEQLERLGLAGEDLAELVARIALILDRAPGTTLVAGRAELTDAAAAALAEGIADQRRALATAGLLTSDRGLPALAEALSESDVCAFWTMRVVDLLNALRDVDEAGARQLAVAAGASPDARWCDLAPVRVAELAHSLRQLADR
jgi:hypothetical protein